LLGPAPRCAGAPADSHLSGSVLGCPLVPYVMIVDDARDSVEPLAAYLERMGYLVKVVPNGREALAEIIRHPPHVLLLDLLMPDMDGAALLEVIRSYLRLSMLPVVVLTGVPDSPLAQRVRDMDAHSVLTKGKATFRDVEVALRLAWHHVAGPPASEN
jgi:CheY-like chemotaxis protein